MPHKCSHITLEKAMHNSVGRPSGTVPVSRFIAFRADKTCFDVGALRRSETSARSSAM